MNRLITITRKLLHLALLLTLVACSKDGDDGKVIAKAPGLEVCIVFAPNELGDHGYADRVLAGMHLFGQQLGRPRRIGATAGTEDYDRVQLRYIAVGDTDAVSSELLRWHQQGTSPYTRLAYDRRLLVLTDRSLLHTLASVPLSDSDEVLVMNVAEEYFFQTPKAHWLGPRLHLLNISAAEAARKLCRRIDSKPSAYAQRQREVWLFQGREKNEVLADSISQAIDEYFNDNISQNIFHAEYMGAGGEAFNYAYMFGSIINQSEGYVVCNWGSLNAALLAYLYLEGPDDDKAVFVDTEIDNKTGGYSLELPPVSFQRLGIND